VFYSEDKNRATKGILSTLPFISLPLAIIFLTHLSSRQTDILKKVFVFSCFIISIFYFLQTTYRTGLWDGSYKLQTAPVGYKSSYIVYHLTYHHLTPSIHAVFFSFYIAIAILIIIFEFQKQTIFSKIFQFFLTIYFSVYLILLTSFTINFALYSFLAGYLFFNYTFKKWQHYLYFFSFIIISFAIVGYLFIVKYIGPDIGDIFYQFDSPSINNKLILSFVALIAAAIVGIIIKLISKKNYFLFLSVLFAIVALCGFLYLKKIATGIIQDRKINNVTVRASYGVEALKIIKKDPLLGVGIGDKKIKLIDRDINLGKNRYAEFGAEAKPEDAFNPHNQFLDFWISAGILPVICFLIFLINEFRRAFHSKNMVYLGLVYFFCLFCFTDTPMIVQRGETFFLFFICFFEAEVKRKNSSVEIQ
jgi:O-antigen ligase